MYLSPLSGLGTGQIGQISQSSLNDVAAIGQRPLKI
jgi:hypothetical protein